MKLQVASNYCHHETFSDAEKFGFLFASGWLTSWL